MISVVVTVVEGGAALRRCLAALAQQSNAPAMEVIVPYDATIPQVSALASDFPEVRFLARGALHPPAVKLDPYTEHELFDRRRAAGLHAAQGPLVAMLEDRGAPREDWAEAMWRVHSQGAFAAVGGAVVNRAPGAMNRALFVCDYGRHLPPFTEGEAEYLTDINICYRREALDRVSEVWRDRYQETAVNWALRDRGERLWLSSAPVVVHERGWAPLSRTLSERLQWGRVFGIQRGRRWSRGRAVLSAAAALALPVLLVARHVRLLLAKGAPGRELLPTIGALAAVVPAWSLGEAIGYLQAGSRER